MDPEPLPDTRRQPVLGVRLPPAPARPRSRCPAGPSPRAGPTVRSRRPTASRRRPPTSTTWPPTERPTPPGRRLAEPTTLEAAIERVVTGDAIVHARRHLPHGRPAAQPGDHAAAVRATSARSSRGPASRRSGRPCATTCGGRPGRPVPGQAHRLVAARPRGHANAAPPVQQRHGLRRRRAAEVGRLGGRARRALVLRRLRGRPGLHRRRSRRTGWSRSPRSTARSSGTTRPVPRQGVRQEGPDDPRDHVHAVRLPRDRRRGEEARDPRVRGADRRPRGPGRARDLRPGGRGHDARERDHLLLLARGRLLPRATGSSCATR